MWNVRLYIILKAEVFSGVLVSFQHAVQRIMYNEFSSVSKHV